MRALLVGCCLSLLAAATPGSSNAPTPGSGDTAVGVEPGCHLSPAACAGAPFGLPGGIPASDIGSTAPRPGCETGRIVTTDTARPGASTTQSDSFPYCPDTNGDGIADLPPPPTHAEITAQVCPTPPAAQLGHNPRGHGITGLNTWLWAAGDTTPRSASGTIRFYPVTCTLVATTYAFDTSDPHAARYGHQRTHTSTQPGSESENTPVQHLFEVTGTYPLTLTITWNRTSTAGADQLTTTTTTDYRVRQIRAGMTTPDS